ncbi:MAG: epoxyqueuosine reductase QueH, partial [Lachnospiraceae bacterium]|nr:epoxyqueuosine reductase QueH [Lachnospiraceae bacterium]
MQNPKVNYQILLDQTLQDIEKSETPPRLLLHACCAPCSSYVLEYLARYFAITIFYYNPNIESEAEFDKRFREVERLVAEMPMEHPVRVVRGTYEPERFYEEVARGYEHVSEGGERCFRCYRQRLTEAAKLA